jgi:hypothetical protein
VHVGVVVPEAHLGQLLVAEAVVRGGEVVPLGGGGHHEADLAGGVGGHAGERVPHRGEVLAAAVDRLPDVVEPRPDGARLGADDAAALERAPQQAEVGFGEEVDGGADRVARVGDDHVKLLAVLLHVAEAVADVQRQLGGVEARGHEGQVALAGRDHLAVDLHLDDALDSRVLVALAGHAAVAAAHYQDGRGVGVRAQRQERDHLLVGELVVLGALDDAVEDQRPAVVLSAKGKNNGGNTGILKIKSKITVYPRKNNFIAERNVYVRLFCCSLSNLFVWKC